MYDLVKATDPTRPMHYEGDTKALSADMFSYIYLPVSQLIERAIDEGDSFEEPVILSELQGGFVWEWASHGLRKKLPNGVTFFACGGDFGDVPNDGNFVLDRICTFSHNPGPGLIELKKVFQPLEISKLGGQLVFINRYDLSLAHLRAGWKISNFSSDADEVIVASEVLALHEVLTGTAASIYIPGVHYIVHDNSEWFLTEVVDSLQTINSPAFRNERSKLRLSTPNFDFEFEKSRAQITKWSIHGFDVFDGSEGPQFIFWRAPTDTVFPHDAEMWALFGVDVIEQQVRSIDYSFDKSGVFQIVVTSWFSPPTLDWGLDTATTYTTHGGGELRTHISAEPRGPMSKVIPRFGLEMNVKRFGRGPGESYRDKKEAAKIGVHSNTVSNVHIPYEFPQENGNRTDTRWVHLRNNRGAGIKAVLTCQKPGSEKAFHFNMQRFSAHEIQETKHPHELGKSDRVIFRIDGGHHGLYTASCGPGTPEQRQLSCQALDFTVDLMGVRS